MTDPQKNLALFPMQTFSGPGVYGTAFLRGRVFFVRGTASVGRYGGSSVFFVWIV
eukprot:SAG11_NODE_39838_length_219_cov_42.016667_1_plen_54_part_10